MNQGIMSNTSAEGVPIPNPLINPIALNQIIAAGVQTRQQHDMGSGLYVPHQQQPSQQQPQQQIQVGDVDLQRRLRPAAIPIKPPPGK